MMVGYPIPTDGVVGRLLEAQCRHPFRPAHLHALIVKEGFKVLISQVYNSADPHIDDDVQFGDPRRLRQAQRASPDRKRHRGTMVFA